MTTVTDPRQYASDLSKLEEFLRANAPANILMPLGTKNPKFCHKGGVWTWDSYDQHHMQTGASVGILMKDLIGFDIDNKELRGVLEAEHPQWFKGRPIEELTKKGNHIIWRRSPLCDQLGILDKARLLAPGCVDARFHDDHGYAPIDVKTITSTGTAGVLAVAPSPGKTWLVAPWETELRPIPDDLVRWLHENKQRCSGKEATKSNRPTVSDPTFDDAWSVPIDVQKAIGLAQELVLEQGDRDSRFYRQEGNALYFMTGPARSCPYSRGEKGDPHTTNNFSLKFRSNGSVVYYCFGADCKREYGKRPAVLGSWKAAAQSAVVVNEVDKSGQLQELVLAEGEDAQHGLSRSLKSIGLSAEPTRSGGELANCHTVRQHLKTCPSCYKHHTSDLWHIATVVRSCWTVRNEQQDCQERLINFAGMAEKVPNENLQGILESPYSDLDYAELFMAEHQDQFRCNGTQMYQFNGALWEVIPDSVMVTTIQSWLRKTFQRLGRLLVTEQFYSNRKDDHLIKNLIMTNTKICSHIKTEKASLTLLKTVKRLLYDGKFYETMDADPYLLGCDNGVIDLRTCKFRKGRPEDMVSLSVGYAYPEEWDDAPAEEVLLFVCQIYPIEEVREFVQRFGGYCLLGHHNEKIIPFFTDMRKGWNGKSTFLSMLSEAMGKYARKAPAELVYKQDRVASINDHSAGLLAFEKIRMAYIEEMDNTKAIDIEKNKDRNGGGSKESARAAFGKELREFPWITKTPTCFNEGKMPHVDVHDEAGMDRFIFIDHCSRFYKEGEMVPDEPHTFRADSSIKEKFKNWRPYFLRWCLEGLQRYNKVRFSEVPEACLKFKRKLLADCNSVQEYLRHAVEDGSPEDFLQLKDLYKGFEEENRMLQRDKHTRLKLQEFRKAVKQCLGEEKFQEVHYQKLDEKTRIKKNSVFLGYKWAGEVEEIKEAGGAA